MLRSTSGPKKGKVTEGWGGGNRYLEHHNLYLSPHIVKVNRSGGWDGRNMWHA